MVKEFNVLITGVGGQGVILMSELLGNAAVGHMRASGDAGGMAADAGEHQTHMFATFSSRRVVIV